MTIDADTQPGIYDVENAKWVGDSYLNIENIIGSQGGDTLIGDAGDNFFESRGAGSGDAARASDQIHGGAGEDTVSFQWLSNKSIRVNNSMTSADISDTVILGMSGIENIIGSDHDPGSTHFYADILNGDDAANKLWGLAGNDRLKGGGGADVLDGGAGADRMAGGAGNDIFVLELGQKAKDFINDFTKGDKLRADVTDAQMTTIDAAGGDAAKLDALKTALNIDWTRNTNEQVHGSDNYASQKDVVIYELGADKKWGGSGSNADSIIMVLEDYGANTTQATELVWADFEIV